jgi:hypothetical protein
MSTENQNQMPAATEGCAPSAGCALTDAATIPQPHYGDLWSAFVQGAREGQKHPQATEHLLNRAADAYCKLWHLNANPESFHAFHGLTHNDMLSGSPPNQFTP